MKFISRLCLAVLLSLAAAAHAQQAPSQGQPEEDRVKAQQERQTTQPGNNAPVWREVRSGQSPYTNSTVKGRETEVLVQSWGETWRQIRNGPVTFYGGWLVVLVLIAILAFYFTFGPVRLHGKPSFIRSDQGAEFTAGAVMRWLRDQNVGPMFKPWQNGFVESFNGKLRDECLSREWFRDLRESSGGGSFTTNDDRAARLAT